MADTEPTTKELAVGQQVKVPSGELGRVASVMGSFVLVERHDVYRPDQLTPTGNWYCTCGTVLEVRGKRHYHHSIA